MLLLGTCNPAGESSTYNGLYYKQDELQQMVEGGRLRGIPVKQEHMGSEVGCVVSSFIDSRGALQCVMEVDESTVEGTIAKGFICDGIALDLSLGYSVDVRNTDNKMQAGEKRLLEISLVRKGARQGCHISAYQVEGASVVFKETESKTWDCFHML